MPLTREQAIALFDGVEPLRSALKLKSRSTIYMWKPGEPIPEPHDLRIRYVLKPEAFDASGELKSAA
jgi:hypothetical protein